MLDLSRFWLICGFRVCAGPPVGNDDHEALLASDDPQLAANKRLVYDWWREVFEAGHLELNAQYIVPISSNTTRMSPTAAKASRHSSRRGESPGRFRIALSRNSSPSWQRETW